MSERLVLGVDGGNSKTDVWLVATDGTIVRTARGGTTSHQQVGLAHGMTLLGDLIREAAPQATGQVAEHGVFCLAGADFPSDIRALTRGVRALGVVGSATILNDAFAGLRAGASRPWGVALVCGHGVNAAGIGPNGRRVRLDGVGDISGDWGGGHSVGSAALAAAVRGRDGRGPRTSLERLVPAYFGMKSPPALVRLLYGRPDLHEDVSHLSALTFGAATAGDPVARGIIDRLADELVAMAGAMIRRLRLTRTDVEVVLTGGVFNATDARFYERLEAGVQGIAPRARLVRLTVPPVVGSVLLALDELRGDPADRAAAERRLREAAIRAF
jgi:N-acetylglucosamine kinase-like BadF-type ATPase